MGIASFSVESDVLASDVIVLCVWLHASVETPLNAAITYDARCSQALVPILEMAPRLSNLEDLRRSCSFF